MDDIMSRLAGIDPTSAAGKAIAGRADIFGLTGKTHDAALRPQEPGGLSHGLRAALACRIARLNQDEAFVSHFTELLDTAAATPEERRIADLAFTGADAREQAIIRHCDLVAAHPRDATGQDIAALRAAGVSEPDIVRLSELVAFVSYQIRVVAGLRLMRSQP